MKDEIIGTLLLIALFFIGWYAMHKVFYWVYPKSKVKHSKKAKEKA